MTEIIIPRAGEHGLTSDLVLPDGVRLPKPLFECFGCRRTWPEDQERAFLRHLQTCEEEEHDKHIEARKNEPLNQKDDEHWDWLRERAENRKLPGIKGIAGYDGR